MPSFAEKAAIKGVSFTCVGRSCYHFRQPLCELNRNYLPSIGERMLETRAFAYVVIQYEICGLCGCFIVMLQEYRIIQPKIQQGICVRNDFLICAYL